MRSLTLVLGFLCLLFASPALAEKRVALVIGMSKYQQVARLANPARDADSVSALLKQAGFATIEHETDLGISDLRRALRQFSETSRDADIAVVYYSGHGIEVDGMNYLVPVDARLLSDFDIEDETVSLERVLNALDGVKRLKLVLLDACRDNPFSRTMKRRMAGRSIERGLARVEPAASETLIAFAAKAGAVANDGDGQHSPFAAAIIKYITEPGVDIRLALGRVRDDVLRSTGNHQEPFVYGSLGGDTLALVPQVRPPVDPEAQARVDYELAAQVGTSEGWDSFLGGHGSGYYANLAHAQKDKLLQAQQSRKKADDAQREAEEQAVQKANEFRKQLVEQNARQIADAKQKLSDQARKELDEARRQVAEQAKAELDQARHEVELARQEADTAQQQVEQTKRQAIADARLQVDQAKRAAAQADKVAALTPDQAAPGTGAPSALQMDPADITRLLQAHLKRVGCNTGPVDGNWDNASRNALESFNKNARTSFDVKLASLDALDAVRGKTDRVCPLVCAKGQRAEGDRCVQIGCAPGSVLNSSGACEKRQQRPSGARTAVQRNPGPQSAPARSGARCFSFGGKSYCE